MAILGKTLLKHSHQHQFNDGECRVTSMVFPVDGKSGNQIWQLCGCSFHGCDRCWTNRNRGGTLKEFNWRGDKVEELKKQTLEITQKIEEDGYEVVSIWECEWKRMKKRSEIAEFLKTLKTVQPRRKLSFDQILKGIQNNTLFGLLIVDIHSIHQQNCNHFLQTTLLSLETHWFHARILGIT